MSSEAEQIEAVKVVNDAVGFQACLVVYNRQLEVTEKVIDAIHLGDGIFNLVEVSILNLIVPSFPSPMRAALLGGQHLTRYTVTSRGYRSDRIATKTATE